ncbi:hypothetical protein M514_21673 [Trichuris suis]|uniref:Uncharacterized protein n=1 Tax=Trichuris suis TaxID=68888 RepID=A0A085N9L3_9BILA|nr:hypothetical protein M514_21673 [Trichuris suis]
MSAIQLPAYYFLTLSECSYENRQPDSLNRESLDETGRKKTVFLRNTIPSDSDLIFIIAMQWAVKLENHFPTQWPLAFSTTGNDAQEGNSLRCFEGRRLKIAGDSKLHAQRVCKAVT